MVMFKQGLLDMMHLFKPPFPYWLGHQPAVSGDTQFGRFCLFVFFFFLNWNRNAGVNSLPKVGHGKGLQSGCSSSGY